MGSPNKVVGIDPGKHGYVVCLLNGAPVSSFATPLILQAKGKPMYNVPEMARGLKLLNPDLVVLEKQQAFPGQGGSSNFSTGYGFGLWEGIISALGIPIMCPHPKTWQKAMLYDIPGDDTKARSIIAAGRMFPSFDLRASEKCRTQHDGKADALLMACYGLMVRGEKE